MSVTSTKAPELTDTNWSIVGWCVPDTRKFF